jgi:hypothetical protein
MIEEEKIPLAIQVVAPLAEHAAGKKTFFELGPRDCRWTDSNGHASTFVFCGEQKVMGRPYCAAHCARAGEQYKLKRPTPVW